MKQLTKCNFLICKNHNHTSQQLNQELLSMQYSNSFKQSQSNINKNQQYPSTKQKQIFSFKFNSFRKYQESDKIHHTFQQNFQVIQQNTLKVDSMIDKPILPIKIYQNPLIKQNRNQMQISPSKFVHQRFWTKNQVAENNSKILSEQKFYKSNKIDIKVVSSKLQQSISSNFTNINRKEDDLQNSCKIIQYIRDQEKFFNSKKSNQIESNKSSFTQKINENYHTFQNIQQTEPKTFFQNIKTIKTISNNQMKQTGLISIKNLINYEQIEQIQCIKQMKTSKNGFRNDRKKTACFNIINKSSQTVKNLSQFQEISNLQQNNYEKKLSKFHQSNNQIQSLEINKKVSFQKDNNSPIFTPSLNNLIQPILLQNQQQSKENTIKQLYINDNNNLNKLKQVNTLKSIGGQSIYSQNSYIDLKFMQNFNSKKIFNKLL